MVKYWELEIPVILSTNKNEIRIYQQYGKIQVFPKIASTPNGVGKGATIDLEKMTKEELLNLKTELNDVIDLFLNK